MGEICSELICPKVSVIIPVFNTELYLQEMLESIIHQSLTDIEIIVINDGSTDHSLEILQQYAYSDSRIKLFSQANQGLSITRNVGLENARGEYIYFMDSDDKLELEALEVCYKLCLENNLDVITFDASLFGDVSQLFSDNHYMRSDRIPHNTIFNGAEFIKSTLKNNAYRSSPCLYIMSKELIDRYKFRFYPHIIHEDQLYTTAAFANCARIMYLPFAFFQRRVRANSIMTQKFSWNNIVGYMTVFDQLRSMTWSLDQKEAIDQHISITLNALLRHVSNGLSWKEKIKLVRICFTQYQGYYRKFNLLFSLMK